MSSTNQPHRVTTWLVTGSSRGIGLEIVRQLVASPNNLVVAAARNPAKASALIALKEAAKGTLHIIGLDVSDFYSVHAAPAALEPILGQTGLDYLINNAGLADRDTVFTLDPDNLLRLFRTNVAGPALLSQVVLPFLEKGRKKTILNISSEYGSCNSTIETDIDRMKVPFGSYSLSKAALNMLTIKQKYERPDLTTITLCPGWVKTDAGGKDAVLEPEESITGILKVITSAAPADSAKYLRYNGEEIPW
ncbi:NAD-P-binding protein [Trametes maxima]|nr:NAD-P-binding protein [Trametes maxima]